MLVVRRYKNNTKSSPRSIDCVPPLFSENIYEPSFVDFNLVSARIFESFWFLLSNFFVNILVD